MECRGNKREIGLKKLVEKLHLGAIWEEFSEQH